MVRSILIIASVVLNAIALAASPPDVAMAHFDKSFYVTGEVVWFKLYLPASFQGKGFSVQLLILNEKGTPIHEIFLPTEGKASCHGYYDVPFDLDTGVYRFWFGARRENGAVDELLQVDVPIYSDLQPLPKDLKINVVQDFPNLEEPLPDDLKVAIQWAGDVPPQPGQPIQLTIKVTDNKGNAIAAEGSVSITDDILAGSAVSAGPTMHIGVVLPEMPNWLSGIHHAGTVTLPDGKPFSAPLLTALDVETSQLYFTRSDEKGRFLLRIPDYHGEHRIQIIEHKGTDIRVSLEQPALSESNQKLRFTSGILNYLELSRKRKKIYQFYSTTETSLRPQIIDAQPVNWKSRYVYRVQDYERFSDLATFFREIIWLVKFSQQKGRNVATMYNPVQQQEFSNPPLFLLDGKATFDADFIGRLDPANIQMIDLLNEPKSLRKYFPALGTGGVIRTRTLAGNQNLPPEQEEDIFTLPGLVFPAAFPERISDSSSPLLAPVLLWQPMLATDKQGRATVHYFQNDDPSTFCVNVFVQSSDGRRGYGQYRYTAKRWP